MGYFFLHAQKWFEHNDTKFGHIHISEYLIVVRAEIDRLRCSLGREGVRSFPQPKTEGAPHRAFPTGKIL